VHQQRETRDFCDRHNIQVESYSPLQHSELLEDKTLRRLADKHGKTPAQIVLRWHTQQGLIAIPKSTHVERLRENFDVFDFDLDEGDMIAIRSMQP
jgi:2,5-diketo-D-gluconate reductase A